MKYQVIVTYEFLENDTQVFSIIIRGAKNRREAIQFVLDIHLSKIATGIISIVCYEC